MLICGREVLNIMKINTCSWEDAVEIYKNYFKFELKEN